MVTDGCYSIVCTRSRATPPPLRPVRSADVDGIRLGVQPARALEDLGAGLDSGDVLVGGEQLAPDECLSELVQVERGLGGVGAADEGVDVPADVALVEVPHRAAEADAAVLGAQRTRAALPVEPDHDLVGGLVLPVGGVLR